MSDIDRKRQHSDEEDDGAYDPSEAQLPPHLMAAANDVDVDIDIDVDVDVDVGAVADADADAEYAPPPHQLSGEFNILQNTPTQPRLIARPRVISERPGYRHKEERPQQTHQPQQPLQPHNQTRFSSEKGGHGYERQSFKRGKKEVQLSYELEKANELVKDLQRLGESPYTLDKDFINFAGVIAYFWSEELFRTNVLKFIGASVTEFPHKVFHFSVIIILANARNEEVGKSFIEWIKARIEEVFVEGIDENMDIDSDEQVPESQEPLMNNVNGWNRVKLLFRSLAVLSYIIEDFENVIQLCRDILQHAIELQMNSETRSPLAEMIFYEFVISIPYILANNRTDNEMKERCTELLNLSKSFIVKESESEVEDFIPVTVGYTPYSDVLKTVPSSVEEYLDDLELFTDFSRIITEGSKSLLEQKAEHDLVMSGVADAESRPTVGQMKKHILGTFTLPTLEQMKSDENILSSKSKVDHLWKKPRYFIEIFSNEKTRKTLDFKTLPVLTSYVSLIIRDIVEDIVVNVEYNRVTVSRQLLSLSTYFNGRTFALPNAPLDKLMIINDLKNSNGESELVENLENNTELPETIKRQMIESAQSIQREYEDGFKSTWKMEELFLETIINLMFALPTIDLPLVYFEALLMDTSGRDWTLSKRISNENECLTFSKLLGDSFRYLYENIYSLKHETFVKFVDWFVYQISNFKFEWEWQEWVPDVLHIGSDANYNKKISFIKNVIHKEILITSYKYIRNRTLPHDFKQFANLALNDKVALQKYDSQFFGREFAEMNTQDPFEEKEDVDEPIDDYDRIIETNTDAYKLFDQYFFNHHEHIYHDICRDVYMNLENINASVSDFLEIITRLRDAIESTLKEDRDIANVHQYVVTLVIQSVCLIGSRSFSVLEEGLENLFGDKVKAVLDVIDDANKNKWVIQAVLRLWNNEPRIGMLFLSKLTKYCITPVDIVDAGWNLVSDTSVVPVTEIWMEQFLDQYILDEDLIEYRSEMVVNFFTNAVKYAKRLLEAIGGSFDRYEFESTEDGFVNDDSKVGLKTLIDLIESKFVLYTSSGKVDVSEIKPILEELEPQIGKLCYQ